MDGGAPVAEQYCGAARRALVIVGSRVSPPHQNSRSARRSERYKLRNIAAQILPNEAVARCGRYSHMGVVSVRIKSSLASYGGLTTCGSVWHCPECAAKIAQGRKDELASLLTAHCAGGGSVYMAAFTIPHGRLNDCAELRALVSTSWRKMQAGAPWKRAAAAAGLLGSVRALEVTHGLNGWHPHLHVLFLFDKTADPLLIRSFGIWLFERWARLIHKAGYGECNPRVFQFEQAHSVQAAGDYVAKWGIADELVRGHTKKSRHGRTPWQLLEAAGAGDQRAAALFSNYAYAFKGARQLTWSRGLRERYGLEAPAEDAELAAGNEPGSTTLGSLDIRAFAALRSQNLALPLLDAVEQEPAWSTVVAFLSAYGISNSAWEES